MRKHGLAIALALLLASLVFVVPPPAAANDEVVEQRVSFTVVNRNTSDLPCPSDGETYEIRGLLNGPRSMLTTAGERAVTLYLHGFSLGGKYLFTFDTGEGYDWDEELARLGHISLSIDRLGYDESGIADGHDTCIGSAADQTHQIVQQLRAGTYTVDGGDPISFSRVVLAGHDTGGAVAEVVAYSEAFNQPGQPNIDALVVWGWASTDFSTWVYERLPERTAFCALGGEHAEDADSDGSTGYFWWPKTDEEVVRNVGMYMEPAVLDEALRVRNRNPCGDLSSTAVAALSGRLTGNLGKITVPVLIIHETDDVIYDDAAGPNHAKRFTGSDDVTLEILEGAGHFPMLERRRGEYQRLVADWLAAHGA